MKEKINQTAGRLKQTVRAVGVGIATLTASFFMSAPAYAAGVQDSQIVKGTEKLVGDVTTWLMVLAPVVAGLLIIYFCIRRGMADEMDQKKWNNRIVVAVVSCIGAVLGSAICRWLLTESSNRNSTSRCCPTRALIRVAANTRTPLAV